MCVCVCVCVLRGRAGERGADCVDCVRPLPKHRAQAIAAQRRELELSGKTFPAPVSHPVWEASVRNTRGAKPNQDASCAAAMAGNRTVVGVFDGHGPHGEQVSGMLSRALLAAVLDTASKHTNEEVEESALSDYNEESRVSDSISSSFNGSANGSEASEVKVAMNGHANGRANGRSNGHANGVVVAASPAKSKGVRELNGDDSAAVSETPLRGPYNEMSCTLKHSRSYEVLSGLEAIEGSGSGRNLMKALLSEKIEEGFVTYEEEEDDADSLDSMQSIHSLMVESEEPGPLNERALASAFVAVDDMLCTARPGSYEAAMVDMSGSTAIIAVVAKGYAILACTGDSRAVLGVQKEGASVDQLVGVQVTVDHKPTGSEADRVIAAGGRVAPWPGETHIQRVWSGRGAAVATSRAFGDAGWKHFGVVATPDVVRRKLEKDDVLLVLCSDGVSDAISNDEIVRAAGVALEGGQDPAAAVCDAAVQAWAEKFGRRRRDDITAVVVRL